MKSKNQLFKKKLRAAFGALWLLVGTLWLCCVEVKGQVGLLASYRSEPVAGSDEVQFIPRCSCSPTDADHKAPDAFRDCLDGWFIGVGLYWKFGDEDFSIESKPKKRYPSSGSINGPKLTGTNIYLDAERANTVGYPNISQQTTIEPIPLSYTAIVGGSDHNITLLTSHYAVNTKRFQYEIGIHNDDDNDWNNLNLIFTPHTSLQLLTEGITFPNHNFSGGPFNVIAAPGGINSITDGYKMTGIAGEWKIKKSTGTGTLSFNITASVKANSTLRMILEFYFNQGSLAIGDEIQSTLTFGEGVVGVKGTGLTLETQIRGTLDPNIKTANYESVEKGSTIDYTIEFSNIGNGEVEMVEVEDILDIDLLENIGSEYFTNIHAEKSVNGGVDWNPLSPTNLALVSPSGSNSLKWEFNDPLPGTDDPHVPVGIGRISFTVKTKCDLDSSTLYNRAKIVFWNGSTQNPPLFTNNNEILLFPAAICPPELPYNWWEAFYIGGIILVAGIILGFLWRRIRAARER